MFILITAPYGACGEDSEVKVFSTHAEAFKRMSDEVMAYAWDAGVQEDEYEDYIDELSDNRAFIEDVCGWVIKEVPGTFIPEDEAAWFRRETNYAKRAYSNPNRYDYDYADDACKNVAYELYDRLGYPTLASMKQEAEGTILDEFEELPVEVFNSEYGYQHPIDADGDMWFCTIGVPDDEHGYVVAITEEDGVYTCRFTQGGKESCVDEGPTPEDAWASSKKKFIEEA